MTPYRNTLAAEAVIAFRSLENVDTATRATCIIPFNFVSRQFIMCVYVCVGGGEGGGVILTFRKTTGYQVGREHVNAAFDQIQFSKRIIKN